MDKRKFVVLSAICSLFFLGTAYDAPAVANPETIINPLIIKDLVLPPSPLNNRGHMPVYRPDQKIDYKILRMKVDPDIDYKMLNTMPSGIFNGKNQTPEFRPDTPFKLSPPRSIPHNPSPEGQPPKPEPPKK